MKRNLALLILGLFGIMFFLYGCETAKGAAEGAKKDWQNAKKADDWMRKNLW